MKGIIFQKNGSEKPHFVRIDLTIHGKLWAGIYAAAVADNGGVEPIDGISVRDNFVDIDLDRHPELLENLEDLTVFEARKNDETVAWKTVRAELNAKLFLHA